MDKERNIWRVKIDLSLLDPAVEDVSGEHTYYLDLWKRVMS